MLSARDAFDALEQVPTVARERHTAVGLLSVKIKKVLGDSSSHRKHSHIVPDCKHRRRRVQQSL